MMGKIILIGGNVDKGASLSAKEKKEFGRAVSNKLHMVKLEIFKKVIHELDGPGCRIEIITSASDIPGEIGNEYRKAFKKLRCKDTGVMHFKNAKEADRPEHLQRLADCDGLIFTGGRQVLLAKVLLKTKFLEKLKKRFRKEKKFLVAGTSAGAMALTKVMITSGEPSASFVKGHIKMSRGFNLLPNIIVDTHFVQRRRLSRLIEAIATYPHKLGIGLGENTAIFCKGTHKVEVIGDNLVILIDGSGMTYNNLKQIKKDENICLEGVKLHVLPKGHRFNIAKRKILNRRSSAGR